MERETFALHGKRHLGPVWKKSNITAIDILAVVFSTFDENVIVTMFHKFFITFYETFHVSAKVF